MDDLGDLFIDHFRRIFVYFLLMLETDREREVNIFMKL